MLSTMITLLPLQITGLMLSSIVITSALFTKMGTFDFLLNYCRFFLFNSGDKPHTPEHLFEWPSREKIVTLVLALNWNMSLLSYSFAASSMFHNALHDVFLPLVFIVCH